jgi:hypothetical protein
LQGYHASLVPIQLFHSSTMTESVRAGLEPFEGLEDSVCVKLSLA